jgi:hypothetical protein
MLTVTFPYNAIGSTKNDLSPLSISLHHEDFTPVLVEFHSCEKFDAELTFPHLRPRRYQTPTWRTDSEADRTVSKKQNDEDDYVKLCDWLDTVFSAEHHDKAGHSH